MVCREYTLHRDDSDFWKRLSLINDEVVINLQRTNVYVLSESVLCLGRVLQHPNSNEAWKNRVAAIRSVKTSEIVLSVESRLNSSGTFSQDSQRCSSLIKSMIYWATWDKHQKLSHEEFYYDNVQWHLLWQKRQQRWMFGKCRSRESICEKIWYWTMVFYWTRFWKEARSPQVAWDDIAEQMLLEFAESRHPTFRATTPLSRGILKSKGTWKVVVAARWKAKAKTITESTRWDNCNHANAWKKMDWHWAIRTKSASYDLSRKVVNLLTFFDTIKRYSEKKMEQLNFTKQNSIFEIFIHKYKLGLMIVGKLVWQQEEVRKEDISIVLMIREESFTFVFFRDILEAISLILRFTTM